jgi:hypothetical protein
VELCFWGTGVMNIWFGEVNTSRNSLLLLPPGRVCFVPDDSGRLLCAVWSKRMQWKWCGSWSWTTMFLPLGAPSLGPPSYFAMFQPSWDHRVAKVTCDTPSNSPTWAQSCAIPAKMKTHKWDCCGPSKLVHLPPENPLSPQPVSQRAEVIQLKPA